MGNRAVILFDGPSRLFNLGIYIHWHGAPASVLAFLECANQMNIEMFHTETKLARFSQMIGNYFGGSSSLSIGDYLTNKQDTDNGEYVIAQNAFTIKSRLDNSNKRRVPLQVDGSSKNVVKTVDQLGEEELERYRVVLRECSKANKHHYFAHFGKGA